MKFDHKIWSVCFALLFMSFPAACQGFSEYISSSDLFFEQVHEANQKGDMPRASQKAIKPLITVLSNSQKFLIPYTFKAGDLGALIEVCGRAHTVVMSYATFDVQNRIDSKGSSDQITAQLANEMQNNIHKYQEELQLLHPFVIRCMAKQVAPMTELMTGLKIDDKTEIRMAGLRQVSAGVSSLYIGVMQLIFDKKLSESFREELLIALSETADDFHKLLPPQVRRQIIEYHESMPKEEINLRAQHLKNIYEIMSRPLCEGLCALQIK